MRLREIKWRHWHWHECHVVTRLSKDWKVWLALGFGAQCDRLKWLWQGFPILLVDCFYSGQHSLRILTWRKWYFLQCEFFPRWAILFCWFFRFVLAWDFPCLRVLWFLWVFCWCYGPSSGEPWGKVHSISLQFLFYFWDFPLFVAVVFLTLFK